MSDDDSKLTRTKRRWADEGKFLTGRIAPPETDRLPPGQHLVKDWPVLDLGQQPVIRPESWRLDVKGGAENPTSFGWKDFLALPQSQKLSDIHCVTTWSRYDNRWAGVARLARFPGAAAVRQAFRHPLRDHLVALRQSLAGRLHPRPARSGDAEARSEVRDADQL